MNKKPNALQKLIHLFIMQRPVTAFFASTMHHIDGIALKLTNGKYTISEIGGWPIIQLTTTGAKTGKLYASPLIGLIDGEKIGLVASSFGRERNPGWYYNLKAFPECEVLFQGRSAKYIAREIEGNEREKYWQMAVSYYKGYELYKTRAAPRKIPIMLLEMVK